MKVEYVFSKTNKIGSKAIRFASKYEGLGLKYDELPSHVAVLLNDNLIVESTLFTGVRIMPYSKWLKENTLIKKIPCQNLHRPSKEVFELLMDVWNKPYDWPGIAFFAWSFIKKILFKEELPKKNPWQSDKKFFCTEYVGRLTGLDCSMKSPAKLMVEWSEVISSK